jgi:hypothetical protein
MEQIQNIFMKFGMSIMPLEPSHFRTFEFSTMNINMAMLRISAVGATLTPFNVWS